MQRRAKVVGPCWESPFAATVSRSGFRTFAGTGDARYFPAVRTACLSTVGRRELTRDQSGHTRPWGAYWMGVPTRWFDICSTSALIASSSVRSDAGHQRGSYPGHAPAVATDLGRLRRWRSGPRACKQFATGTRHNPRRASACSD